MKGIQLFFCCIIMLGFSQCTCDCFDECDKDISIILDHHSFDSALLSKILLIQKKVSNGQEINRFTSELSMDSTYNLQTSSCFGRSKYSLGLDGRTNEFFYELVLNNQDTILLDRIEITGDKKGSPTCRCYSNHTKSMFVNGEKRDAKNGLVIKK